MDQGRGDGCLCASPCTKGHRYPRASLANHFGHTKRMLRQHEGDIVALRALSD